MSKKHIVKIEGQPVEVSEEVYTYLKHSEWNSYYTNVKRKRERIRVNTKRETVKFIPSKEDSFDRLIELGAEFETDSEPFAEAAIRKITVQQALEQLTADERFIIVRIYFEGDTERELAKTLQISQTAVHNRKKRILLRLRKIIGE